MPKTRSAHSSYEAGYFGGQNLAVEGGGGGGGGGGTAARLACIELACIERKRTEDMTRRPMVMKSATSTTVQKNMLANRTCPHRVRCERLPRKTSDRKPGGTVRCTW